MKFRVYVQQNAVTGEYEAKTVDRFDCYAAGSTYEDALNNIRDEIRYRVEISACAWVRDDYVQLEVEES